MKTLTAVIRNRIILRRVLRSFAIISPLLFLLLGSTAVSTESTQTTTTGPFNSNLPTVSGVAYGTQYGAVTTFTPTNSSCVTLITLMYGENFTGVIHTNVPAMGNEHGLIDNCVSPGFAEISEVSTMTNVTIAGRTGTLVLRADTNIPAFTSTVVFSSVFNVVSGSGGLTGITGHGINVGSATSTGASLVYWFQFQFNNAVSVINVSTVNSTAKPITGSYTTLWQNGQHDHLELLASCFSPCSFAVNNGQSYQVSVSDFGSEHFSHWTDGTLNRLHSVHIPRSSTTIPLTAVYTP